MITDHGMHLLPLIVTFTLAIALSKWFRSHGNVRLVIAATASTLSIIQWWCDVVREDPYLGHIIYLTT